MHFIYFNINSRQSINLVNIAAFINITFLNIAKWKLDVQIYTQFRKKPIGNYTMEHNYKKNRHIQQQFSNSEAFKNAYAQILSQIAQLLFLQFCSLV